MNENVFNYDIEIDTNAILDHVKNSQIKTNDLPKVVWHNLPSDDSASTWRFLPYFKNKTFFQKIEKHWDIPGLSLRTVTCPRSFIDPETKKPYPCALCEEQYRLYKLKSKDEGDEVIMKALRTQSNYLTNAIDMGNEEKGIGVLALPYNIWQSLVAFLQNPHFSNFFQVKTGRPIWIKPTYKAGTSIPGNPGKQKRDYTITPMDTFPITDYSMLESLYDLEKVLGIPTYETTKGWLKKMLTGDPGAGEEYLTGNLYMQQLGTGDKNENEEYDTNFSSETLNKFNDTPPFVGEISNLAKDDFSPTSKLGDDGFPVCYASSFDENNKICLKCDFADSCETAILKQKREEKKNVPNVKEEPKKTDETTHDSVQEQMLRILNKVK